MDPTPLLPEKTVICPQCGGDSLYSARNPFRPFCSARCKNIDFGAWASEGFSLPADSPPDSDHFGDPKLQ
jgi:uncharacterized protein